MTRARMVEVFRTELEATRSMEAAVGALATAVLAEHEHEPPPPTPLHPPVKPPPAPPPPPPPKKLRGLSAATQRRPPKRTPGCSMCRNNALLEAVAALYGTVPELLFDGQLRRRRRHWRATAPARWVASSVLRRTGMSMPEIAVAVGLADHSTVIYGLRHVEADGELAAQVDLVWRQFSRQQAAEAITAAATAEAAA